MAPAAGPLLGGWITDSSPGPDLYITVPLGLGAMAVVWQLFRDQQQPRRVPLDRVGLVLLVVWGARCS